MRFYTDQHPYYYGTDLHAHSLYVCILNDEGQTLIHKEVKAQPELLLALLTPYAAAIMRSTVFCLFLCLVSPILEAPP